MTTRIGINGFGRIGRVMLRQYFAGSYQKDLEVVAINDLCDSQTLAHLLRYDSVHRKFNGEVEANEQVLKVNGKEIRVLAEKDPGNLPWKDLGVDIVLESTGIFRKKEQANLHLRAGAKKVIISAPAPDPDVTIVMGVNHTDYKADSHQILSCASCTTNCLAPMAKVLLENFGIVRGTMTTIHSYTNDQRILDLPHKDLRRARAAAVSMIPTTTGAAKAVGLVLPQLKGKVDGFAMRVPTADVSVTDFVCEVERDTSVEEVNRALKNASEKSLNGILGFSEEPLVSVDYTGDPRSSIIDALSTMVVEKRMVKVVSWYDNEAGFSTRMLDLAQLVAKHI
ncbi:MAG: type I glyceraldehyde-3-phosphate dehydrogenase [Bdellovibrionales bacterium]|nr:type I glyceraldehyde-3-phosphate dehydrogenase [Bdellovibrionales bacterium]